MPSVRYLGRSCLSSTIYQRGNKLYLRAQPLDSDEDSDSDSYDPMDYDAELFFWMLWRLLLGIVRMIPYNHLKQELLVIFLKTLHGKKVGIVTIWLVRISYFLPHTGS